MLIVYTLITSQLLYLKYIGVVYRGKNLNCLLQTKVGSVGKKFTQVRIATTHLWLQNVAVYQLIRSYIHSWWVALWKSVLANQWTMSNLTGHFPHQRKFFLEIGSFILGLTTSDNLISHIWNRFYMQWLGDMWQLRVLSKDPTVGTHNPEPQPPEPTLHPALDHTNNIKKIKECSQKSSIRNCWKCPNNIVGYDRFLLKTFI